MGGFLKIMAVLAALGATAMDEADPGESAYVPARPVDAWPASATGDAMPTGSREAGEWGRAGLLFDIGADGAIGNCRVALGTPYPRLDASSCAWLAAHARFAPATVAGQAVKSLAFETIDWGTPPVSPPPEQSLHTFFSAPPAATAPSPGSLRVDGPPTLRSNPQALITSDDYPEGSLRNGEEGAVLIMFDVSEAGRPEHCRIEQSTGFDRLDATSCMLVLRRQRYWPALLKGKPVRGTADMRFRWMLPHDERLLVPAPPS